MHLIPNKCNRRLLMKISSLAILLTWFATVVAASSTAQHLTEIKASLPSRVTSLKEALKQLENQTDIRFTYVSKDINAYKQVQVNRGSADFAAILDDLLEGTNLAYQQVGKTVIIKKKAAVLEGADKKENGFAQPQRQGRIVDETGKPLAGVTVRIKGTPQVTSTDQQGFFEVKEEGTVTLIVSYIGYQTQEIVYVNDTQEIVLAPDFGNLDAVTVIAYGTTSKRVSTGSTASITSEELSRAPVNNVLEALQGQIAGLDINATSGLPGSSPNVRLRGINSIAASSSPLYIVDGVPFFSESLNMFTGDNGNQSPIAGINPSDIERIDVLKDADATAIYGSRGANGVILITTKKGKGGSTRVNFNAYTGASKVTNMVDMLSTTEYLELRREAFQNSEVTPDPDIPDLFEWDKNLDQNWQKKMMGGTGKLTEANVSLSGGSETTNFLISGTLRKEGTVQPGDNGYNKGSGMLSVNHNSADGKFSASATANYTGDFNNAIATDISQYYDLPPNMPIYNDDGSLYWYGNIQNPYALLLRKQETRNKTLLTSGMLRYSPVKNLNLSATIGYNNTTLNQLRMLPISSFKPDAGAVSTSHLGNGSYSSYSIEPQASYALDLGIGKLDLLAGLTWQQGVNDGNYFIGEDFTLESQLNNIDAAVSVRSNGMRYSKYRYQAGFARATYNLNDKYIINGTFRRDGSSRFGPDRRVGNFGSIGAAWVFSEEEFIKDNTSFLSFGKLRGSYGVTGNDQIDDYGFMDTWSFNSYPYDGVAGLYPTRVANPLYSWETTRKVEIGLELGFLDNKLTLNVNRYLNKSENQLIMSRLSPQTGFTGYTANLPAIVQNRGWEFELRSVNLKNESFEWSTSANLTVATSKLLAFPGLESLESYDRERFALGYSLESVYGYKFTGVDSQTGIAQFEDINGDGELNAELDDMYVMGTRLPKFFGGMNNSFTYKNLNLSFLLQFAKQEGELLNYGYMAASALGTMTNFDVSLRDRWRQPNQQTDIPRSASTSADEAYSTYNTYYRHSDALWGDASYIRLKNVMLSYDFTSLLPALKTQRIMLYGQGQNLLTFTKYDGFDPETKGRLMPPMKQYTVGIRFTY
ncbi:TonB-dependent receptor [Sphingobacterium phlebotomi]|uniref:TonB-dependent receptor n=2 Tax=Sphingobacterium phlebotomi TaxID=2605433 RepID=A0A5D4HBY6_9SPHI|nr:TonB-dependent receptor [Sphingobacterium phlebotomi]